jgi:hypothetical protein
MRRGIAVRRLHNQCIAQPRRVTPAELVQWLGAVQAQEYQPAKWGLALRLARTYDDATLEQAISDGQILRTHVMRPTWHFVARDDLHWMLELTAPRVHKTMATYIRHQGLERPSIVRGVAVLEKALSCGTFLTRTELGERLADAGFHFSKLQMSLLMMYAELEAVVCSGPRRGKHFTYALLSDRAPARRRLDRDEALGELCRRFFSSHGPATIRDFVWWSGLTTADARRGLEIIRARSESADGVTYWTAGRVRVTAERRAVHLLPIYDEYLVAYRDRLAVPHGPGSFQSGLESVTFQHAVISKGQVVGTWRTRPSGDAVVVSIFPLGTLSSSERRGVAAAAARYGRFLDVPVRVTFADSKRRVGSDT